jgi:hypothetical protein
MSGRLPQLRPEELNDAQRTLYDARYAATIDATDYTGEGQQSLEFSDLTRIVTASVDQGVSAEVLAPVHEMIQRQIAAGHGKQGFARIFEELRTTR